MSKIAEGEQYYDTDIFGNKLKHGDSRGNKSVAFGATIEKLVTMDGVTYKQVFTADGTLLSQTSV